jgi:hypothetical protein
MGETTGLWLADMETNDLTQWTAQIIDSGNTLTVTTGAQMHGTYGLRCLFGGTAPNCCSYKTLGATHNEMWARTYVRFHGITTGSGAGIAELGFENAGADLGRIHFYSRGTGNALGYVLRVGGAVPASPAGANQSGIATFTQDTIYCVEIHWKNETAGGAGGGGIEAWINGSLVWSGFTSTNGTTAANRVFVGNRGGDLAALNNEIHYDDVKADSAYIGLYNTGATSATVLADRLSGFSVEDSPSWIGPPDVIGWSSHVNQTLIFS